MTGQTDEFVLAEQVPGSAPARAERLRPAGRRASTWALVGVALVVGGVLTSPGPIYPPLEEGIAWNVLDLDLTTEPAIAWTADLQAGDLLGHLGDTVVLLVEPAVAVEGEGGSYPTIVGIDASTGDERWRIDDQSCQLGADALTCVAEPGSPGAVVSTGTADGLTGPAITHPGTMSARVLSDGGMLVIEGGTPALAELVRIDAWGAETWRSSLSFSGLADASYGLLDVVGARISTASGWFDLHSGTSFQWSGLESAAGGEIRETLADGSTVVTLTDGREIHLPPGELPLDVDDALGGPVSLHGSSDGALVATWDGGSSTFTTRADHDCHPLARLHGAVLEMCLPSDETGTARTRSVDQLTGEQLWEQTGVAGFGPLLATANTLILCSAGSVEGVDPRTGEARWSVPAEGQFPRVIATDDYLIVLTTDAVMRLG